MRKLKNKIIKMLGGYTIADVIQIKEDRYRDGYNVGEWQGRLDGYEKGCKARNAAEYMKGYNDGLAGKEEPKQ